jgi:EF hand
MGLTTPALTGDYAAQAAKVNEKYDFAATLSNDPQAKAGANAMKDNANQIFGVAQKFGINLKDGWQANEAAQVSGYIADSGLGKQMQAGHRIFTDHLQNATTSDANLGVNGGTKQFVTNILDPHFGTYGFDKASGVNTNQDGNADESAADEAGYMNLLTNMPLSEIQKQLAPEDNTGNGGDGGGGAEGAAAKKGPGASDGPTEASKAADKANAAKEAGAADDAKKADQVVKDKENTAKIIDKFDTDKNGRLDKAEIAKLMGQYDTNGDGIIDEEELAAMAKALGMDPAELMKMLDKDGSGDVSADELGALQSEPKDAATKLEADGMGSDPSANDPLGIVTDAPVVDAVGTGTATAALASADATQLANSNSLADFMNTDTKIAA